MNTLVVAIVSDLLEEGWPSMDLVAAELTRHLAAPHLGISPRLLRPAMQRRLSRFHRTRRLGRSDILDRLANRHWDYPRWLAQQPPADVYHVIDHSYAHLALALPARRTVVSCHDLDAFRCLLPGGPPQPWVVGALARRTQRGLARAAKVICGGEIVRDELVAAGLARSERTVVVPYGVHPAFSARSDDRADAEAERLLGAGEQGGADVLHVGSSIPRKRLDVLLRAFAIVARELPQARLIRVGGLNAEQRALADTLGVARRVVELPFLDAEVLAAVYRRAAVLVMTSDREGFGLPIIEALACDTPVVASDIPALRETGGLAARFVAPGNAPAFAAAVLDVIRGSDGGRRDVRSAQAARFSWSRHAERMAAVYRELV